MLIINKDRQEKDYRKKVTLEISNSDVRRDAHGNVSVHVCVCENSYFTITRC
jgi:hypothetical protein